MVKGGIVLKKANSKLHKLRYWREVLGLKQGDVAILLGCKSSNYCQKENGKTEISLSEMKTILAAFNKTLDKLGRPKLTMDELYE